MNKRCVCLCLMMCAAVLQSAGQVCFPFDDDQQEQRFYHMLTNLKCVVCQGQNLKESFMPIAMDMKTVIYQQMKQQHTDDDIIQYLTMRYGDHILFMPPVNQKTWLLWLGPIVMLLLSLLWLSKLFRSRLTP